MSHNEGSWWSSLGLVLGDIRGQASSRMTRHEIRWLCPLRFTVFGILLDAFQTRVWLLDRL
jgi:hypothetical protein